MRVQSFVNLYVLPRITSKRLPERPGFWLVNRLDPIIEQRQKTPTSRVDVLQLMLQVMTDEKINEDDAQESSKTNYRLTRKEVLSNILVFMAAGYETTSTYVLARHPDVLENFKRKSMNFH